MECCKYTSLRLLPQNKTTHSHDPTVVFHTRSHTPAPLPPLDMRLSHPAIAGSTRRTPPVGRQTDESRCDRPLSAEIRHATAPFFAKVCHAAAALVLPLLLSDVASSPCRRRQGQEGIQEGAASTVRQQRRRVPARRPEVLAQHVADDRPCPRATTSPCGGLASRAPGLIPRRLSLGRMRNLSGHR